MTWLDRLVADLVAEHRAVAVILYGSRAAGRERPESDVDLMLLARAPERTRDARRAMGPDGEVDVDAWVYPIDVDPEHDESLLRLRGGRVLVDPEGHGARLMAAVDVVYTRGPKPIAADERQALEVWGERMLARIAGRDSDDRAVRNTSRFRQAELLTALLPDVYLLRGWWYPGPDPALRELASRAPALFAAYERALAPDATLDEMKALVRAVMEV